MIQKYNVTIKEVNKELPIHTSISTDEDLSYIRDFFGLEEDDVEWYTIDKER